MTFTVRDHLNPLCSLVVVDGVWGWSRQQRPDSFTSTRQALRTLAEVKAKNGWVQTMVELVHHGTRVVVFDQGLVTARSVDRKVEAAGVPVTGVRVERLQDISEKDEHAEGCPADTHFGKIETPTCTDWFRLLWQSINGPDSWAENPWVWVVEFKRVTP